MGTALLRERVSSLTSGRRESGSCLPGKGRFSEKGGIARGPVLDEGKKLGGMQGAEKGLNSLYKGGDFTISDGKIGRQ